jgi:hypothetical protein
MKSTSNKKFFKELKEKLSEDVDVIISENKEINITIFFQEQMCNITDFTRDFLPQLVEKPELSASEILTGIAREVDVNEKDVYQIIFNGLMIMYDHKRDKFFLLDISKALRRSTGDSNAEPQNIIGSRDGFTENYKDNISLLRSRVKNSNFMIEEFKIGRRSKTWVGLVYIKDIHNEEKRIELGDKLRKIDIDALITINDILPHLSERYIFPIVNYIGLPDLAVTKLLDGEFIIVIDRIPTVLVTPTSLSDLMEERVDYVVNKTSRVLQRVIVLLCFFLSTIFLGLFLSVLTYQIDVLSLPLLSTFSVTQKGAIFPIFIEITFVLFLFELYYFVGFRSSEKTLSSTIVLIGGLIIGQNLIDSGLVGVVVITITALCFLATFVVTNNILFVFGISVVRLIFLLSGLFFGFYGVTLCLIIFSIHFAKQSFLGEHFFHPFIPFDYSGFKDFFKARANKKRKKRNTSLGLTDETMKGE